MRMNTDHEHREQQAKQSRWGFRGKTVWDWMALLIVPLALVVIGLLFTMLQDARQQQIEDERAEQAQKIENQRAEAERELAEQRAQDEALQAYLDQMSQLMLERNLLEAEEGDPVHTLAQARTSTVILRLDAEHNQSVTRFLIDSGLAEISKASARLLRGIALPHAKLSGAALTIADLSDADLSGANLRGAGLTLASLSDAYLRGADLSDVVRHGTMVDGAADEAILTVRQCSEADASVGPLKERIYEIMPQMPEETRLGETERAGLLVSPLTVDEVSESDTSCVELADRMKAQLVPFDVGKLVISRQQPNIQELSSNRVTRWGWDITARQTGKLELIIDLRYAISPEGQEFRLVPQSPVYEGAIRVTKEQPSP
jgi:hypothetical protein